MKKLLIYPNHANTTARTIIEPRPAPAMMSDFMITQRGSVPPKSTAPICVGTIKPSQKKNARP